MPCGFSATAQSIGGMVLTSVIFPSEPADFKASFVTGIRISVSRCSACVNSGLFRYVYVGGPRGVMAFFPASAYKFPIACPVLS